jgi:hypothetical protein
MKAVRQDLQFAWRPGIGLRMVGNGGALSSYYRTAPKQIHFGHEARRP